MTLNLKDIGVKVGRDRVLKYMGIMGIQAIYPHKKKQTSIKDNKHKTYAYLLKEYWSTTEERTKSVEIKKTNEVWSGDITYIRTALLYLLFSIFSDFMSPGKFLNSLQVAIDNGLPSFLYKLFDFGRSKNSGAIGFDILYIFLFFI
jgi:putative transposase